LLGPVSKRSVLQQPKYQKNDPMLSIRSTVSPRKRKEPIWTRFLPLFITRKSLIVNKPGQPRLFFFENYLGASGASTDRALRGSALSRSGPTCRGDDMAVTKVSIASFPFRGQKTPTGVAKPLQSLAHEPSDAYANESPHASPPIQAQLNWCFVKPGSGARRAVVVQQHAQRFTRFLDGNPVRTRRKAHPLYGCAACVVRLRRRGVCGGGLPCQGAKQAAA
jgi:hypothetical protein